MYLNLHYINQMSRTVKKPYSKAKSWDKHCRNNNACNWCRDNRLHKHKKQMLFSSLSNMSQIYS